MEPITPIRPEITFADVAGCHRAKQYFLKNLISPDGVQPGAGALLLCGLPGAGKTMLCRAAAGEAGALLYHVSPQDILSRYVGEAERRICALFDATRRSGRAVIALDSFEAYSGMSRFLSELFTQMLSREANSGLLVIAVSSRPWEITGWPNPLKAFEHRLCLPLPDAQSRLEILQKRLDDVPCGALDLNRAAALTEGFSCADVLSAADQACRCAVRRTIALGDLDPTVLQADLDAALASTRSTVNAADVQRMEAFMKTTPY